MLDREYYYNKTIKKTVAAFGTLFNDIKISRGEDGLSRVPLTFAPKERYLSRINARGPQDAVAIKLPRMSFEITSINVDLESKLNRMNRTIQQGEGGENFKVWQSTPYILGFSLNILSRGHDEALQIVEQILPFFNPNYTLTVKGMEGPDSKTDIPIALTSVNKDDSYEGEYESSRRTVIYTLDFEVRVKFIAPPVSLNSGGLIKAVDVSYFDDEELLSSSRTRTEFEDQIALEPEGFDIEFFEGQIPPVPVIYTERPDE
jgi:hypothetical protein